jgi:hypothetical protein
MQNFDLYHGFSKDRFFLQGNAGGPMKLGAGINETCERIKEEFKTNITSNSIDVSITHIEPKTIHFSLLNSTASNWSVKSWHKKRQRCKGITSW